jgi:hypothetical protein
MFSFDLNFTGVSTLPFKRRIPNYITVERPKSIHKKTKEMLSREACGKSIQRPVPEFSYFCGFLKIMHEKIHLPYYADYGVFSIICPVK